MKSSHTIIYEKKKLSFLKRHLQMKMNYDFESIRDIIIEILENKIGKFEKFTFQKPQKIHVDLSCINDCITNELDIEKFKAHPLYASDYANAEFVLEDGKYIVGREVEKMSKSKYNVVNPDDICNEYGADTLRLYEMFLGPLRTS